MYFVVICKLDFQSVPSRNIISTHILFKRIYFCLLIISKFYYSNHTMANSSLSFFNEIGMFTYLQLTDAYLFHFHSLLTNLVFCTCIYIKFRTPITRHRLPQLTEILMQFYFVNSILGRKRIC